MTRMCSAPTTLTTVAVDPSSLHSNSNDSVTPGNQSKKGRRSRRRRSKARKSKDERKTAQKLGDESISVPFGGVAKFFKDDDFDALVARSPKLSNSEMLAFRQQIWDLCERCARNIWRGP